MSPYLSRIIFLNTRKDLPKKYRLHHRMVRLWRYLWRSSRPSLLLKPVHLEQPSTHLTVHSSNSHFLTLPRRMLWETASKALQKSRQKTSTALPDSWAAKTLFAASSEEKAVLRFCPLLNSFLKINQINFTYLH